MPTILRRTETAITTKLLAGFVDGTAAEVVAVRRPGKSIICFSTMIGCPVGCRFCWSGIVDDYRRTLSSDEMTALIGMARIHLPDAPIVYSAMGEGEPALNVDAVMETFTNLDLRSVDKLALSTAGPNMRAVERLVDACRRAPRPVKIQYSLHAASTRPWLMRGAKAAPSAVLSALAAYERQRPGMVEINVVPMHGVNSEKDQRAGLVSLLMEAAPRHRWSIKVNRHNAVAPSEISAATSKAATDLIEAFRATGFGVEWYETDGQEIEAACGQLHHQTAA